MKTVRHLMIALPFALGMEAVAGDAGAQNFPARPIRLIVPQAPGSASDTVARIVAARLGPQINQQVVVDNRPGGALTIGMDLTAKATPPGGLTTVRGIGASITQFSTLTHGHTTTLAPPGNGSGGRPVIGT